MPPFWSVECQDMEKFSAINFLFVCARLTRPLFVNQLSRAFITAEILPGDFHITKSFQCLDSGKHFSNQLGALPCLAIYFVLRRNRWHTAYQKTCRFIPPQKKSRRIYGKSGRAYSCTGKQWTCASQHLRRRLSNVPLNVS